MTDRPDFDPIPEGAPDELSPAERDKLLEAAVLRGLLVEYPTMLTADEVTTELTEHGDAPGAVDDAIRRLVSVGLVHRHGQFVVPSRAALYMDELPVD